MMCDGVICHGSLFPFCAPRLHEPILVRRAAAVVPLNGSKSAVNIYRLFIHSPLCTSAMISNEDEIWAF